MRKTWNVVIYFQISSPLWSLRNYNIYGTQYQKSNAGDPTLKCVWLGWGPAAGLDKRFSHAVSSLIDTLSFNFVLQSVLRNFKQSTTVLSCQPQSLMELTVMPMGDPRSQLFPRLLHPL